LSAGGGVMAASEDLPFHPRRSTNNSTFISQHMDSFKYFGIYFY
jgi:hypothetical protein